MPHLSDSCNRLSIETACIVDLARLRDQASDPRPEVCLLQLPAGRTDADAAASDAPFRQITDHCAGLHRDTTVCVLTTPPDAARLLKHLQTRLRFQLWIAVKLRSESAVGEGKDTLPTRHAALLVLTRYRGSLRHASTRIAYTYCPACGKTTKDYGGKKHTYHAYGTLMSDVWRDIEYDPHDDEDAVQERLRDVFGLDPYGTLRVVDLRTCAELQPKQDSKGLVTHVPAMHASRKSVSSRLLNTDCLKALGELPDDSIDFCFADPPYNLQKKYDQWDDAMKLVEYFEWCDKWLSEMARVLRPGRILAVINIPIFAARHYWHLCSVLDFQAWIAWEGLSFPVRRVMPAHYGIVCFSKGKPRALPGLRSSGAGPAYPDILTPLAELYCLRAPCMEQRRMLPRSDRGELSDLWYDIHRLKHNSRRVDHPCQLPPRLMARLIALFTQPGEVVLDCFNGAGTTTLVAQQLGRGYVGIELSSQYHNLALRRHSIVSQGGNPFAKNGDVPIAKNSRVQRLPKRRYLVTKKQLQLEVRRIARQLGRLPTRADVAQYSEYPMEYFEQYFVSWGEVCAAARTTGMSELPPNANAQQAALGFD